MPKLLWVSLPLLLAAVLVAVHLLRRRPLSRWQLNAWLSLLLLAYLLTTAGLGIFWVANQQLPVFDWHYLFGYGTVLLVLVHLWFNLPAAWRHVTRRKPVPAAAAAGPVAPARRNVLGTVGALLAGGVAFALGLRHGRSELRIEAAAVPPGGGPAAGAGPRSTALAVVEQFHAFSSHSRAGVLARAPGAQWGDPPPAFKSYPQAPRVALPAPAGPGQGGAVGLAALATVLHHTTGVTQRRGGLALRASPSSGGLFSTELYVAAHDVAGLAPGWWHYDASTHALQRVGDASAPAAWEASGGAAAAGAVAAIVATAVFGRTGHKYRDRTYRYVLADLGHALENLRVAARAAGLRAQFVAAFDEAHLAAALRLDEVAEGVLALVALHPARGLQAGAPQAALGAPSHPAPRWQVPPLPAAPPGLTAAVHAATSLRAAAPLAAAPAPAAAAPGLPGAIVLQPTAAAPAGVLAVIAARRSVRRYAERPLPAEALSAVLQRMARLQPPLLSAAVRIDVVVHAVEGIAAGSYRYEPQRHALLPRRAPAGRRAARAAALDQDVIGDAAVVFVLSLDRAAFATDPLGPARGYRHGFLEAGLVGERIYLEAGARGLGVCAVGAFYDDEAAALVGIDPAREWVLHFAALGVPAS